MSSDDTFPTSQEIVDNALEMLAQEITSFYFQQSGGDPDFRQTSKGDTALAGHLVGKLCEHGMLTGYMSPDDETEFNESWPDIQRRTNLREEVFNLAVKLRHTGGMLPRTAVLGELFTVVDAYEKLEKSL